MNVMKTTVALLMLCALIVRGQTHTNLILTITNDVPIGHTRVNFGLASYSIIAGTTNFEEAFEKQGDFLYADERNCEVFGQADNYQFGYAVRLIRGTTLHMEIKTMNGVSVPKSAQGKAYFKAPKPHAKITGADLEGTINGVMDLPKLDDLFNFPSNGEYVLEARCWYLNQDGPKAKVVLSNPVRLKVIMRNVSSTNSPLQK